MTAVVLTPNNFGGGIDSTLEPNKFNPNGTNGLTASTLGVRLGGTLDALTTIDGAFTLVRNGGTATALYATVTGASISGVASITTGNASSAFFSNTVGAASHGGDNNTSGAGSHGVRNITAGGGSHGVRNTTSGVSSYGVVSVTSGNNSAGVANSTSGVSAHGVVNVTTGATAHGIFTITSGFNSHGVYNTTSGVNSYGVFTTTTGDTSGGVRIDTSGAAAPGVLTVTMGAGSHGAVNRTAGVGSHAVDSYTTGANSHGMSVSTIGSGSYGASIVTTGATAHGVYSQALGAGSYAGYFDGDIFYTGALTPSDERLKENITPIKSALAMVLALRVVEFDKFKESSFPLPATKDGEPEPSPEEAARRGEYILAVQTAIGREFTDKEQGRGEARIRTPAGHRTGVIAQEVQQVMPQFVREGADGFLALDESGINYMLLRAVQELAAQVAALQPQQ